MRDPTLSRRWLLLLLLWSLSAAAGAAGVSSAERGGAGRGQRRGGGGGGEKKKRYHRIQHGQCSYTFILPELDGCQAGGWAPPEAEQYGGSRGRASVVQRDSPPPTVGEWSSQKLQRLENTMENNTQWLRKVLFPSVVDPELEDGMDGTRTRTESMKAEFLTQTL